MFHGICVAAHVPFATWHVAQIMSLDEPFVVAHGFALFVHCTAIVFNVLCIRLPAAPAPSGESEASG